MLSQDTIQYALQSTRVLHEPDRRIDTFGSTKFHFYLVSELMDSIGSSRVRKGYIEAERPVILKPQHFGEIELEGFEEKTHAFKQWIEEHIQQFSMLKYGFNFKRSNVNEEIINEPTSDICKQLIKELNSKGDPSTAVIEGIDDSWEICLMRFTIEMIHHSQKINLFDFKRKGLL